MHFKIPQDVQLTCLTQEEGGLFVRLLTQYTRQKKETIKRYLDVKI